jgi:WD40 repeat protein
MNFGCGISGAALLVQLAWKIVQGARQACGEYDELTREVSNLHRVLRRLHRELSNPDSLLNQTNNGRREELGEHVEGCEKVLRVMDDIITKYNLLSDNEKSGRRIWQNVKFGNREVKDLADIRPKLSTHTSALNMSLHLCSLGSQGKFEKQLNGLGGDVKGIRAKVDWIAANMVAKSGDGTVWTSYSNDDKAFWRELRRELVNEGYDSSVLSKFKNVLRSYVEELCSRGSFDHMPEEENSEADENERNKVRLGDSHPAFTSPGDNKPEEHNPDTASSNEASLGPGGSSEPGSNAESDGPKYCEANSPPPKVEDKSASTLNAALQEHPSRNATSTNSWKPSIAASKKGLLPRKTLCCPNRRCRKEIGLEDMHVEDDLYYGKCSLCNMKVCLRCKTKWHWRKDCPKDEDMAALRRLKDHSNVVSSITFSLDGKLAASGSDNRRVRFSDAVTGSGDKRVQLWDTTTGTALHTLKGHSSTDSKLIASGSYDKTVRLWDVVTGAALQTLKGHSDVINFITFSLNNKLVASGSNDKTLRLWDATTGAALQTFKGHSNIVSSIAFSPNSKLVASGSYDCIVRLWGVATGASLTHSNAISEL